MDKVRDYRYDNLKAILIFLVVFGHLLYPLIKSDVIARLIYIFIFTFHMPAFVYVMGKFSKPSVKRTKTFFALYLVFQLAYTPFLQYFSDTNAPWTFITPHWILWFLLASCLYSLIDFILPVAPSKKEKLVGITVSVAIALLAGFISSIGDVLALSRSLVFFPFFLMGKWKMGEVQTFDKDGKKRACSVLYGILAAVLPVVYTFVSGGNYCSLWQRYSYAVTNSEWHLRALAIFIGFIWIKFLLGVIPNKRLPIITDVGKHTLVIFLGHGFLVKLLIYYFKACFNTSAAFVMSVLVTIGLYGVSVFVKKLLRHR